MKKTEEKSARLSERILEVFDDLTKSERLLADHRRAAESRDEEVGDIRAGQGLEGDHCEVLQATWLSKLQDRATVGACGSE